MVLVSQLRDRDSTVVVFDEKFQFILMQERRNTAVRDGFLADHIQRRVCRVQPCLKDRGFFGKVSGETVLRLSDLAPKMIAGFVAGSEHEPAHRIGVVPMAKAQPCCQINLLQDVFCAVIVSGDGKDQLADDGDGMKI